MEELLRQLIDYAADNYDPEQDLFLLRLLQDALDEICEAIYPYGFSNDTEEKRVKEKALRRYRSKIRKIAEYHYDKAGKEGVTGWSESGSSVSYESSGTPSSYLRGIIPIAKIV